MAVLTIRRLDEKAKEGLRARAKRNGRSLESEVRMILTQVAAGATVLDRSGAYAEMTPDVGVQIREAFKGSGDYLEIPERRERQREVRL
ncbi:MAG: hypothetical protein LBH64_04175 [Coriobacteriales bacterium]|jgi:plasmid stability protein|nr:hypothetical protein [Coriobacteriales bacterium]